jgi:lipopolysaccharide transport system permease protein
LNLPELWGAREILFILTWRDIMVRYKQTILGAAWAVLQPFMFMVVLSVFLGLLAKVPSDGYPYPLFVFCGLVPWTLFAAALTIGSQSLVANEELLTKVYFPRLLIPTASVLAALVDLGFALATLGVMMIFYGHLPGPEVFLLPLGLLLAVITALAIVFWLSALNVRYRDVRHMSLFLTTLLLYLSPIIYPVTLVPEGLRTLYGLNPIAGVVEIFKGTLLGNACDPGLIAVSTAVAIIGLVTGWTYFSRTERSFADVI